MKDLIEKIYKEKKMQRVSWNDLAENLPISGEALRVSFVRESVDENYLNEVCKKKITDEHHQTCCTGMNSVLHYQHVQQRRKLCCECSVGIVVCVM